MWNSWWEEMPQTKEQHSGAPVYHRLVGTRTHACEIPPRVHVLATEAEQQNASAVARSGPGSLSQLWAGSWLRWELPTTNTSMIWEVLNVHVHGSEELIIR